MTTLLHLLLVALALPVLLAAAARGGSEGGETVIVHLGDSITSTIYLEPAEKIDAVLQSKLERVYPDHTFRNVNLGLDGEWVEAFLENRYDSALRESVDRADIFIIRYGTNDAQHEKTPAEFAEDLRTLIDRLRDDYPGCSILMGTGPHIKSLPWCNTEQYGHHWQAVRDLGAELDIPVVDVYARFEAEHGKEDVVLGKNDSEKDIHPNARGVAITAEELGQALKPVLTARDDSSSR